MLSLRKDNHEGWMTRLWVWCCLCLSVSCQSNIISMPVNFHFHSCLRISVFCFLSYVYFLTPVIVKACVFVLSALCLCTSNQFHICLSSLFCHLSFSSLAHLYFLLWGGQQLVCCSFLVRASNVTCDFKSFHCCLHERQM